MTAQEEKDYIATVKMLSRANLELKDLILKYEERIAKMKKQLTLNNIKELE